MSKLPRRSLGKVAKSAATKGGKLARKASALPVGVVTELVEVVTECKRITALEETKRETIRAQRDVAVEKIRATRQILEKYLDEAFAERIVVLRRQLDLMDEALHSGNMEALNSTLGAVTAVLQNSPLKDVRELGQQIANDDYTLSLE